MREAEARIVHDLRNAATVLGGAAAQLRDGEELPAGTVARLMEIIGRRSELVLGLIDELSALHERRLQEDLGVGTGSQRVPLAVVCREALERRAPAGTSVTLDVPDDAVAVGEPMRVVRILDNLLTNAFRYGGPHVTVSARRDGSFVTLEVHDDGPGVPPSIEDSVFDAHVRGPRSESLGGSGLGLAIVRELCATMGGTAAYRNRQGASFTVTLPAAPDTAPTRTAAAEVPTPSPEPVFAGTARSPAEELVDALAPLNTDGHPVWRSRLSTGRRATTPGEEAAAVS